jgi:hypothetical protein
MSERTRDRLSWALIAAVTLSLSAATIHDTFRRYREFRLGWAWDLSYYNQWLWAATHGDRTISVRPISSYANEGPSIWRMNYLSPVRFLLAPLYRALPQPDARFLLVVQGLVFWWLIPAAYSLARSERASRSVGILAALLVPLAPAVPVLAVNDYRELQIGIPFVLWAVQGWRSRSPRLLATACVGLLACRQEWAVVIASLSIVPAREPESIDRTFRWRLAVLVTGAAWVLIGFFGYLSWAFSTVVAEQYVAQVLGPRAPLPQTLDTAIDFLWVCLGAWILFALFAPRVAILAVPWVWSVSSGLWTLRLVGTEQWHHIRYTAPFVAMGLAAGVIGWTRLAMGARERHELLPWIVAGLFAIVNVPAWREMTRRIEQIPSPVTPAEADTIWTIIESVSPIEDVLAAYPLSPPFSARKSLYSDVLEINRPVGYPDRLPMQLNWIFQWRPVMGPEVFERQGFRMLFEGPNVRVFRRSLH